jgi:hypothetical protein
MSPGVQYSNSLNECSVRLLRVLLATILIILCVNESKAEYLLHSLKQQRVGAGNYTYFKLSKEGSLQLVLYSEEGDADMYISESTLTPTSENYDVMSATCGVDVIELSAELKRPVGVGIFGHPFYEVSVYTLEVYADYDSSLPSHRPSASDQMYTSEDDENSLFYKILIGVVKIILDIMI